MEERNVGAIRLILGVIILFEMGYCLCYMPTNDIKDLIYQEQTQVIGVFGEEDTESIYQRADEIFTKLCIDSGLRSKLLDKKIGEKDFMAKQKVFAQERSRATLNYFYLIIARISHVITWLPFLLVILFFSGIDGLCMREIKKTNFDWVSPVKARYASRLTSFLFMLMFMNVMSPFGFTPYIIPLLCIPCVILISFSVRNIQKRI